MASNLGNAVTFDEDKFFEKANTYKKSIKKLTRKQRRQQITNSQTVAAPKFVCKAVFPKTTNQKKFFEAYDSGANILAHGVAGTGKTFLAIANAMTELNQPGSTRNTLYIVRSAVSARDIGFLPGSDKDKIAVYEPAYKDIFTELYGRSDAYDIFKKQGTVKFVSTSFLRGLTIRNAIVIVDEMQNMNFGELDTIMTRLDGNSRIIFCGDYRQTDLKFDREKSGLGEFMTILKKMNSFSTIEFGEKDIVRGGIVKEYIISRLRYDDSKREESKVLAIG